MGGVKWSGGGCDGGGGDAGAFQSVDARTPPIDERRYTTARGACSVDHANEPPLIGERHLLGKRDTNEPNTPPKHTSSLATLVSLFPSCLSLHFLVRVQTRAQRGLAAPRQEAPLIQPSLS